MTEAYPSRQSAPAVAPCLKEIAALFRRMHDAKIEYCHWKSNEHLGASIRGETDLDILVARRDVCCLAQVLGGTRFKRCLTAPARQYPGIESYVGLDEETGRLIHLHVHYQLTVGERHLKGYRVPWEHLVLARRVYRETEGLYVVDPELELLLLVIRAALKLRNRDLIRAWVLGKEARPDMVREFHWLASRVDREELAGVADRLVGSRAAQLVGTMVVEARVTPRALARLRGALAPGAQEYRTYAAFGARCRRWMRELLLVGAPRLRLPQGGAVVVVVGADGSGKSTVVRELTRWLSNNLDATSMYLGSGQGPVSMPRQALQRAAAVFKRVRPSAKASAPYRRRGEGLSRLRTAGELLWVASLAVERRRRAAAVRRARNRGTIVLCDRFPQSQTAGNDGPWLGHWLDHSGWARRTVARQELASLRCVERLRPDLVIKLAVTREVAALRKPETAPHLLDTRLQVLEQLRFDPESRVVELDATRPLERVLLEAKREIWSML